MSEIARLRKPRQALRDLKDASRVQRGLFPGKRLRARGWDFAARCRPARLVAGDCHDLFEAAPGRVAVVLGDVSGKGVAAGLVSACLQAFVRGRLPQRPDDLPGLVAELNDYLLAATPEDMFATLFVGLLELRTGRLRYVNAGHPAPVLLGESGGEPVRLREGGTVLGVLPSTPFEEETTTLGPNELLATFSDGITEATDGAGQRFRERRVLAALDQARGLSARRTLTRLLKAVAAFAGPDGPADDLSAVIVRRTA